MEKESSFQNLPRRIRGDYLQNRGADIKVVSNYFPIKMKPFSHLYIFKVVFAPKIMHDNRTLRLKLLNQALPSIKKQINNPVIGGMNIYSVNEPNGKQAVHEAGQYKITITQVKCINVRQNPKMLLHFLNNGIRNIMTTLNYMQIGQTGKYFNKQGKKAVLPDLSIYPGYKANFLLSEAGMFLRVDPTSKLVQNKTVLEFINQLYKLNSDRDRDEKRQKVKQALANKIVMTNYGKTRYVRVLDIQFLSLKQMIIPGNENLKILDYYAQKYNIVARENQPLLRIQNKNKNDPNPIYILPELCLMTGLPPDFDEYRRKKLSDQTIASAETKFKNIKKFIAEIKSTDEQHRLFDLGIKIEANPQEIQAKNLPAPTIYLGKENRVDRGKESSFNLFSQPIFDPKFKLRVGLIYFDRAEISELSETFIETAKKINIDCKVQKFKISPSSSRPSISQLKNNIFAAIQNGLKEECNIFLIVIRADMKNHYKDIKKFCLEDKSIVSQVVVESTLRKKNARSVHTKILLQTAAKIGNTLWAPSIPMELKGKTMLVSFDFSKAGGAKKLIGIATVNETMTKFTSQSMDLEETAEKFQKMVRMMINFVTKYTQRNGKVPREVILLTNSCPRNEIQLYYDYFIPHLASELNQIGGEASSIKLTIIQTKDLSSQRFFKVYSDGVIGNPDSGLLVSNTIVSDNYDFYLVSQKPRVGSSVPIHFNVISSNSNVQEGIIQELMYSQCFNYANWTGSIKIPAIMQYAKKFARFSSQNLKGNISDENLCSKLYFI